MKMGLALAGGLLVMASLAQAAEIKVLSGNGAKAAVRELCTQFERAIGNSKRKSTGGADHQEGRCVGAVSSQAGAR